MLPFSIIIQTNVAWGLVHNTEMDAYFEVSFPENNISKLPMASGLTADKDDETR